MTEYNATPDDNQLVSELEADFRDSFMKPQFIGCTWAHFQENVMREKIHGPYEPQEVVFFARLSAPGYLDATDWMWDTSLTNLVEEFRDMYL